MAEVKDKDKMSDRLDKEKPFNIEERMGRVEGALGQMGERLNHVETAIGDLRNHVDAGMSELRDHVDTKMDRNFRWTIGIIITMWVTIILTIIFKIP
jgi:tetrahydromethanopterin S-methyltransferase subunit G